MTRRLFAGVAGGGLLTGCSGQGPGGIRVLARPGKVEKPEAAGTHTLVLRDRRNPILYVPASVSAEQPAPLMVYLHGATGSEQQGIKRLSAMADKLGFLLLSPASEDSTWDAIQGSYGPDVRHMDTALTKVFARRAVDPARIAVSGFSDGASYALGFGLANGDLFRSVVAFSPGFFPSGTTATGKPRVFISHGTKDQILPIDTCSRQLVPALKRKGYPVTYKEFDGPHTVPAEILEESLLWWKEGTA